MIGRDPCGGRNIAFWKELSVFLLPSWGGLSHVAFEARSSFPSPEAGEGEKRIALEYATALPAGERFLYAFFMPVAAKPSRGFMGVRPTLVSRIGPSWDETMLDLAFVALGAALFLGALIYARGCARI